MGNDEKFPSRDDETSSHADHEKPAPKKDGAQSEATGASSESDRPESAESDFGMPAFGLFEDEKRETGPDEQGSDDALTAARIGLDNPPQEGTGWENTTSIETPSSAETEPPGRESEAGPRSEATVMPFPSSAIQRPNEPAPSDMLRSSGNAREADLFGSSMDPPAEALPDFDPDSQDSIADAVQSALRNVYGGPQNASDDEREFGSFGVADSLRQAGGARSGDPEEFWADRGGPMRNERREDVFGADRADPDADAVLDSLYGDRRAAARQEGPFSGNASLRDLGDAMGYDRDPRQRFDYDERGPSRGAPDYDDYDYRQPRQGYGDPAPMRYRPDDRGYRDADIEGPDWDDGPYVASSSGGLRDEQFQARIASANTDSLASANSDSSHLLGAAGLGLIGGIALAGVLAVFVFNSFVEQDEPAVAELTPKVVERLDSASPAPAQPGDVNNPSRPEVSSAEPQVAATRPEPEPRAVPEPDPEPSFQPDPAPAEPVTPPDRLSIANVSGQPGRPIPIDIQLPDPADRQATLISLKGLPPGAKLSTGIDVGGGQWLLPPDRIGNLTVTLPPEADGRYSVEAELLQDDAQTVMYGPVSFELSIGEAAQRSDASNALADEPAPEADAAATQSVSEQAAQLAEATDETQTIETDFLTQMLIRDGNKMMRDGDILGARQLYEQAAANGNPEAALAMGRSFDPSYFEKLPVKTGKPDPATAFQWYKKALEGGLVTARVKIDGLKQWLQQ